MLVEDVREGEIEDWLEFERCWLPFDGGGRGEGWGGLSCYQNKGDKQVSESRHNALAGHK